MDDETCECGHVADEHETAPGGHPGECAAEYDSEPCICVLFEAAR